MSNGIDKNPLLDISKVYLEKIVEKKDDSYLEPDMKKRQKNNEKARKEMEKVPGQKNPHFEEKQQGWESVNSLSNAFKEMHKKVEEVEQIDEIIDPKGAARMDAAKGKKKVDVFAYDRKLQAQGKLKGKKLPPPPTNESLDPVGQEDDDIDNDGKKNTKSDKYLGKRRKAIANAMKKRMTEQEENIGTNLKSLAKKATKRIDADVDGDVDTDDPKSTEMGEFVPSVDGKKKLKPKVQKEGYSDWRNDLTEVAPMKDDEEKEIKEKKVNNKITINPKLGEEVVSEMGGTLIEMVEYDEFDGMVEGVYFELQEEGYEQDDIEEALEWVLTEARVTYGSDTESPRQQMMKKAKGRLRFLGRKVGEKMTSAKKKVGMASAKAQVSAYNKAREAKQSASDIANRIKKSAADAPKKAKKGLKAKIKGAAEKVAARMSEEAEADPKEKQMLAKKKTMMMKQQMLDKQRMQAQMQGKLPSGHRVEQKESMSAFEKVKAELAKKHGAASIVGTPENKAANAKRKAEAQKNKKKPAPDTRTDAQKMADATGPRPGSRYRGD